MTNQSVQKYLDRISVRTSLTPSKESLFLLQMAHLMHVPFENIDIYKRVPIDLSKSFEKIVDERRGGFCYELNGLFYQLLMELGFKAKMIAARVVNENQMYGPEFDHMAIIVSLDADYLVDVGFGDFSILPLKLVMDTELIDSAGVFMFEKQGENILAKRKKENGFFITNYVFTEQERSIDDFIEMNNYHQSSPDSHFTKGLVCSILTETGRITLTDKYLKVLSNGVITKSTIKTETDLSEALKQYFLIGA